MGICIDCGFNTNRDDQARRCIPCKRRYRNRLKSKRRCRPAIQTREQENPTKNSRQFVGFYHDGVSIVVACGSISKAVSRLDNRGCKLDRVIRLDGDSKIRCECGLLIDSRSSTSKRCLKCNAAFNREKSKRSRDRNPGLHKKYGQAYYSRNRERILEKSRKTCSENVSKLADPYVKAVLCKELGISSSEIPQPFIELKRLQLKLKRAILK